MEYGIANYEPVDLAACSVKESWLRDIPVEGGQTKDLFLEEDVAVALEDEGEAPVVLMRSGEEPEVSCLVQTHLEAPISKGQIVGTIQYRIDGEVYWQRTIRTTEAVEERDYPWFLWRITQDLLFT
jgi:D-alanyl-D-alanine carboxypeptidase (penicillin-binding protein 5/6)